MSDFRVASRYAKSLLELAGEKNLLEEVHADMQLFDQVCQQNSEFARLLASPVVLPEKKLSIIKSIFSDKISELSLVFLELVCKKDREKLLPAVAKQVHVQYNALKKIQEATVVTTFPLDDQLRNQFKEIIRNASGCEGIELTERVDKDLVGGYILKIGDRQIDDSISRKLHELKQNFMQN
ncbi:ATP synthase F1 subunit delta [Xanthovirga aplysinae]|uniref:ATP synthase F1 subunit delta n=1 Tax=Xanthovirga aplysinae TaxID=2529853 RepID=UPI0012BB7F72|nr:ATP synthase F1 subunit delta [Xanthovirga aplysinae]MTI31927.1 ATP synthase F1 subunit delta [Xanthovirga aplysinae]